MAGLESILEDFKQVKKTCDALSKRKVYVGIVGGGDAAKIAYIHEYGGKKMPERSFIRASFDQDINELDAIARRAVTQVLDGQKSADAAMNAVGAQAAQLVQGFIDANRVTPPSNFSRKTQYTTLYETGTHIRDRIAYKVEDA